MSETTYYDNSAFLTRGFSSGGVGLGATDRAVQGMSIGAIKSWQDRRERVWQDALDEYDQQFQAPITIETNYAGAWVEFDVIFNLVFVLEPTRDSNYDVPQFTYGVEYKSGTPVHISVMVKSWVKDVQGVRGAKMMAGAFNPATGKMVKFVGVLHLNFQGFGGPESDESESGSDE